ncbi:HAD family hydrolase [Vibrio penaeicida]|uniref:HAD family hydrolase n=1 Tax=Vibrio penaeicida TaxID=104609 RepID=A0AAV5NTT5_9VIBR|nr:HAD family hydrolase [Vibrio penaeicida]RTZ24116.1 HAD family hydrolase [Vibrio penaeicida]GLQ74017.1 hypothetical protein GCM10007932_33770 [Vibrio penaeicida]
MIKAVYFDLDNTLVDRNASIDRFALKFYDHFSKQLVESDIDKISSLIKTLDNGGYLKPDSPYKRIYTAIAYELPKQLNWHSPPLPIEIEQFWKNNIPECAVEMNHAHELISTLKEKGLHLGIISNGEEWSRQRTAHATSFSHHFSQIISSEKAGYKKPDSRIFIESARSAGYSTSECIYVGDHPVNDVQGSINAGMKAIWLSGYHPAPHNSLLFEHARNLKEVQLLLS